MDFWLLLKNSLSIYIHPLTIAMELIVVGVVMVGFSRRRKRKKPGKFGRWLKRVSGDLGVAAVITGVFLLFLASIKPIADPLIFTLEKRYPPLQLDKLTDRDIVAIAPEFIVVLAGGERFDPEKPPTSQLSYAAQARVNEGARLASVFPKAMVVFTGQPDEVRAMTESILALGVSRDRILSESESRETQDHPRLVRPLIGDSRFLLVTSGTHMPRAMAVFEAQGYEPIPAACDLWVWPRFAEDSPYTPENFIPKIENLWMTNTAFHEYMGLAWLRLSEANQKRSSVAAEEGAGGEPVAELSQVGVEVERAAPLPLPERGQQHQRSGNPLEKARKRPPVPLPEKETEAQSDPRESEPAPVRTPSTPRRSDDPGRAREVFL